MLRISALNDSSSSEDDSQKIQLTKTKEAKEAEAFAAYNKALSHQQKGNTLHAEKLLRNLFDHPLLKEASSLVGDENQTQPLNHPGLQLLYSIHKNLASILLQRGHLQEAIAAYIEAVKIDSSEVTVWFKMGQLAKELYNYPLAKISFQQALQCNPNHWPSLDNAITVTYALGDYLTCLENISTALEKDYTYPKGLAFRKQILSEQPSLESVTKELFLYCDPRIHSITVDTDEAKEYINEALKFRATRRQMILEHQEKEQQPLTFQKPLTPFTWKNVGEQLIDLYDFAVNSNPPKSLALEVDLRDYFFLDHLVFLGENSNQGKPSSSAQEKKEERLQGSTQSFKTACASTHSDAISVSQVAKVNDGKSLLVPPSLNIKDSAKESALVKRIQGDMLINEPFTTSECTDIINKVANEELSEHVSDANEPMVDELELEAMDMNDVPLLQDEDINMAVLSLKDIRKADFRPELLLKTNDEDFKELPDARTLENVLSTVIDLELQEMYQKVIPQNEELEATSKDDVYTSPLQSETGPSQIAEANINQFSMPAQNALLNTSKVISDAGELSADSDKLFQYAGSSTGPASTNALTQSEVNTVLSVVPDVSSANTLPVLNVCGLSGQRAPSTCADESLDQPMESVIPESTPDGHILALPVGTTPAHSSHKLSVSVDTTRVKDPLPASSPHRISVLVDMTQTQDPLPTSSPHKGNILVGITQAQDPLPAHSPHKGTVLVDMTQAKDPLPAHSSHKISVLPSAIHSFPVPHSQQHSQSSEVTSSRSVEHAIPPHSAVLAHTSRTATLLSSHIPHTQGSAHRPQSPRTSSSIFHSSTPTCTEPPPVWTVNLPSETVPQSPKISNSSPIETSQANSLYYSLIQASQQANSSLTQVLQTVSPGAPVVPNVMTPPLNLLEKSLQNSFKPSVLAKEFMHSPITTSLLSPNSSSSCPKSASVYHTVLSNIDKSDIDSSVYKSPSQKPELSQAVTTGSIAKSPQKEENFTSLKNIVHQTSSSALKSMNTDEYIADVANQLLREACADRSLQKTKIGYSSPQQPPVSTHHMSSASSLPSPQTPSKHSPHYHHELLTRSHGLLNPSSHHRTPSSGISFPWADTQTCMTPRIHSEPESFMEGSSSFPHPLKLPSKFDIERRLEKAADLRQTGAKRVRPPPLARSASLPGYHTHSLEHNLLSYLSIPQTPYPLSPFQSSERRSPHIASQPSSSLLSSMAGVFSPTCSLPCSHPDAAGLFTGPLYSSFSSVPPTSTFQFPTSTAIPPYLTPPRPPKYIASQHSHHDYLKLTSRPTSKIFSEGKIDNTKQKPRSIKTSPSRGVSHRRGHHSYGISLPASKPPLRLEQSAQQTPKLAEVSSQLQSLARIAQQVSPSDDIYSAVSGDHSYHQKRGQMFQAMVESLLTGVSPTPRPARPPLSSVSPKGFQLSLESSPLDSIKKRGQAGNRTPGSGAKRGPKRKIDEPGVEDWAIAYKRRSTRSRNARNRKEDQSIDYQNMVKKYFPQSLLHQEHISDGDKIDESDMEADEIVADDGEIGNRNTVDLSSLRKLTDNEEDDVKAFIKKCLKRHGVLDLIYKFLLHLAKRCDFVWYEGIADIYTNLYMRLRKHLTVPSLCYGSDDNFTPEGLMEYAMVILTWSELSLSKATAENETKSCLLPVKSGQSADVIASHCLGEYHSEDLMFLLALTGREDALGNFHGEFCIRFYWLKAKQHQFMNETVDAVECFEIISELLEDLAAKQGLSKNNVRVIMPNLSEDRVISVSEASKQLECLRRCRSLENTQKLFDEAKYDLVVENLVSTFNSKNLSPKSVVQRERPSQLLLLVNSLYNTGRKTECLQWAEASLHEAVLHYKRAPTAHLQKDWASTLVSLFTCINRVQDEDEAILKTLIHKNLARMAESLVFVVEVSLNVGEHLTEMPIASLLPWKILYRLLRFEEINCDLNKQNITGHSSVEMRNEKDNDTETDLKPSLLMLKEAHEYLGRHAWCTKDDGSLLLFIMSVVEKEMEGNNEEVLEELTQMFEQCVYCLYGHPNKRGRARHLRDHNSTALMLTWERSGPVFRHFAAQSVPEFDSYRTSTVTADVENLLRRIFALVPDKINPGQKVAAVTDYIEGASSSVPNQAAISISKDSDPYNISGLLYYLLGDFYFKSKEPTKAVKFYQLDLVLNTHRLDSWAGLALAIMSQIEQKLNSTELKIEKPMHKHCDRALRCFRRAVELETGSCKLWLEYGSLAYQLHSYASRQIKYKDLLCLSEEVLQPAISNHTQLLLVAKNSYQEASKCEGEGTEESWLISYMMGKVAEKQREKPIVYLDHYMQAAVCLHEEKAVYPKKIQFVSPRPHLALEALEIFYRIHVSVLKLVLSGCEVEYLPVLDTYVSSAMQGHFARGEEKQQKTVEEDRDEMFVPPKAATAPPLSKPTPVYHKNPVDHNYSLHKSTNDMQSEGEDSKKSASQNVYVKAAEYGSTDHPLKNDEFSGENMEVDNRRASGIDKGSTHPSGDATSGAGSMETAGVSTAEVPFHQQLVAVSSSSSCAPVDQHRPTEDKMDTSEPAAKWLMKPEAGETPEAVWRFSEENIQDPSCAMGEGKISEDERDTRQYQCSSQVIHKDNVKPENVAVIDCKQSGSLANSEGSGWDIVSAGVTSYVSRETMMEDDNKISKDIKLEDVELNDIIQNGSQIGSQNSDQMVGLQEVKMDGCQVKEHSVDDAVKSCGNMTENNVDAMDVDGEDDLLAKPHASEHLVDAFISNQTKSEVAVEHVKICLAANVIEIHADDSVDRTSSLMNITSSELQHQISGGFTVSSVNVDAVSDNIMDVDSFEDNKFLEDKPLSSKEVMAIKETDNTAACVQPQEEKPTIANSPETGEMKVVSLINDPLNKHRVDDDTAMKCEETDVAATNISQTPDSKADLAQTLQGQDKSGDCKSSIQIDSFVENCMNAAGDLKDSVEIQSLGYHDTPGNTEENRLQTQVLEKCRNVSEELPESVKSSSVYCEISDSIVEPTCSQRKSSVEASIQPPQELPSLNDTSAMKELEVSGAVSDHRGMNEPAGSSSSSKDLTLVKVELISKCRTGLEICASRFPCHYKSLYRLAHLYYHTKELNKARDILLGRPDWQEHSHMPTPGLFAERKQNNFFQGLWKIPAEDIDRTGSFATHVHRSVRLLLDVLCDLGDLEMLKNLHNQLRRTPETGKKYLRDAERLVLAEEAFLKCATVVHQSMQTAENWPEEQKEENLLRIYQVWVSGKGCKHIDKMTDALLKGFKILMKGRTDVNRLTAVQAISFCQQNLSKSLTPSTPVSSSSAQNKISGLSVTDKTKDVPSSGLEKPDLDQPSTKPTEQQQTQTKQENVTKAASVSEPRMDGTSGAQKQATDITTSANCTPSANCVTSDGLVTDTKVDQKADDDVIILSD